ncbi:MAG: DUF3575 domain-containing protein [Chitinophagaceae bacterium]|nr:MAG: DUF3575 domain-containing protein [Chitinophagaceae bacterium]
MNKLITAFLVPALFSLTASAQLSGGDGSSGGKTKEKTKIKTKVGDAKPFTVKWNPASLAFGKIGLSGEYNLKRKKSVTFGIGIPLERTFTRNQTEERIDLRSKTFSVMAGYRMYLGKKSMTGFYFEPYLKHVNFKSTGIYDNKDAVDREIYQTTVTYAGTGVGAQVGVQFMIAKVVVFDLFLIGPEANISKFEADFKDIQSNVPWTVIQEQDARREIEDVLKDIPVIGDKTEVNVYRNERRVNAQYKGFLPGFRFGLSVGIHF